MKNRLGNAQPGARAGIAATRVDLGQPAVLVIDGPS